VSPAHSPPFTPSFSPDGAAARSPAAVSVVGCGLGGTDIEVRNPALVGRVGRAQVHRRAIARDPPPSPGRHLVGRVAAGLEKKPVSVLGAVPSALSTAVPAGRCIPLSRVSNGTGPKLLRDARDIDTLRLPVGKSSLRSPSRHHRQRCAAEQAVPVPPRWPHKTCIRPPS
jgi:hypothetical protein